MHHWLQGYASKFLEASASTCHFSSDPSICGTNITDGTSLVTLIVLEWQDTWRWRRPEVEKNWRFCPSFYWLIKKSGIINFWEWCRSLMYQRCGLWSQIPAEIYALISVLLLTDIYCVQEKISPVGDWRSTSLEWPWPWFRPYGIPSCITHRLLPTYQISLRSEENFFWKSPLRFWSSSESRDTNTRTNTKNPARSNLDIVL